MLREDEQELRERREQRWEPYRAGGDAMSLRDYECGKKSVSIP